MVTSALIGLLSTIAFVTVTWSGQPRRVVIAIILFSILLVLVAASASLLTAARDTYVRPADRSDRPS